MTFVCDGAKSNKLMVSNVGKSSPPANTLVFRQGCLLHRGLIGIVSDVMSGECEKKNL